MDKNKEWMSKGKIGCTFASLFAKNSTAVNWKTIVNPTQLIIPEDCMILSIQFPNKNKNSVLTWALDNGFFIEEINDECEGLRYNIDGIISWVQYFGPDSHVKTRQAPIPELCMCVKLSKKYYAKVGFKGILHLAHTSIENITDKMADILWKSSHDNTKRKLGHKPTIKQAAKTTYIK